MTAKTKTRSASRAGTRYLELIRRFPLRPLRSEPELDEAIEIVNGLIDRDKLASDEEDYLDVLGDLIRKYETEHHPMPPVSDTDMLRFLIESRQVTLSKVAEETRVAVSTISEVLAGKRTLNRRHIEAFAKYFHVETSVFMSSGPATLAKGKP
ncbi:helix-turn-helix domain-containing protein [Singulisphaera acidiphila]|uniref:Putative transcription regulator containing HTH domain n=1 Tax=Singulisphaera acidiphila (strain ATCC BAA-1392 / DSM 18658 / VKM B-2454 / MOB10) TaxID=886293 RepID=L0DHC2_SINAD|nr:helix-turn-helix domain-containing protein [Singulisphaera acidiphila]AGA28213.1 putative transcription regulator containing HTH domain [Singulisphaera acidiphila DSM 18658]